MPDEPASVQADVATAGAFAADTALDYTVHLPVSDPGAHVGPDDHVFLDCRSPHAADGMAVEDGVLWAPDGTVLAVSRQTRLADDRVPRSFAAGDGGAQLARSRPEC